LFFDCFSTVFDATNSTLEAFTKPTASTERMSVDPPPESTSGTAEYSTGSFSGLVMTQSNASTEQPPAEEANDRHSHGTNVGVSVSYDIDDLGGLRTDTANLEATAQSATAVSFATNPTEVRHV
jgi:predicted porin